MTDEVSASAGDDLGSIIVPLATGELLEAEAGIHHVHAAGVALGGRAIVVPGASGVGKTTLTLHLAADGALLSDEILGIDPDRGVVTAPPRPLQVKAPGIPEIDALGRDRRAVPIGHTGWTSADQLGVTRVSQAAPHLLLSINRRDGPTVVRPLNPVAALELVLRNSFDLVRDPVGRIEQAVWLVAHSRLATVTYGEAAAAAPAIRSLAEAPTGTNDLVAAINVGGIDHPRHGYPAIVPEAITVDLDDRALVYVPSTRRIVQFGVEGAGLWSNARSRGLTTCPRDFIEDVRALGLIDHRRGI